MMATVPHVTSGLGLSRWIFVDTSVKGSPTLDFISIQCTPSHPISLKSILILLFRIRLETASSTSMSFICGWFGGVAAATTTMYFN